MAKILRRIEEGEGNEEDLAALLDLGKNMTGTTICVLSDSAAAPTASSIQKFRDEYLGHIRDGVCPARAALAEA
jgi:NADH-quinone oxidoreductase subunit F